MTHRAGSERRGAGRWALIVLLLVVAPLVPGFSSAVAGPPPGGGERPLFTPPEIDENAVTAQLLAETTAVVPGQELVLGLHLHMKPGWHTYWQNGGDAGLPTTIDWMLPEGFEPGPIDWPVPHRYVEVGNIVTYGYADDTVLLVRMKVPPDLQVGTTVELKARVDWLQCKELCVPGEARVSLRLPVETRATKDPATAPRFAAARARLPRPVSAYPGLSARSYLSLNAVPPGQTAYVAFVLEGLSLSGEAEITWLPELHPPVTLGEATVERSSGSLRVVAPLQVDEDATPGSTGKLAAVLKVVDGKRRWAFQLEETVPVAAEGQALRSQHEEIFRGVLQGVDEIGVGALPGSSGGEVGASGGSGAREAEAYQPTGSIWRYLLLALIGGIILNIMPCVLPVLSLKVMGFVSHADRDRATVFRLSLMFAAGVLASFVTLATVVIALQRAGALLGWGFQFQNPVFVVVMVAVVFGFGLNLFGLFEIVPPVGRIGGGKGQYTEQFFNGVLATILATPCSAPFLGTALGFAFTQPAAVILAIFLTIGVGLALPYVLLSINPSWLRFVPKPGMWMERFKQFMGFLLMATAVWLLWVLGKQLGGDGVIRVLWFLLVLSLVLWIHGAFLSLSASRRRRIVVWLLTLILLAAGWKYFLGDTLSSEGMARAADQQTGQAHRPGGREWVPFSPRKLESMVRGGKTVFLDFTAAWCLTCKANEKAVIDTDAVNAKFDELKVVTMVGDWTQRDPEISKMLRKYGRSGVPFYAVFPAGRPDEPIVLPEVINKSMVIEALEKAGPSR